MSYSNIRIFIWSFSARACPRAPKSHFPRRQPAPLNIRLASALGTSGQSSRAVPGHPTEVHFRTFWHPKHKVYVYVIFEYSILFLTFSAGLPATPGRSVEVLFALFGTQNIKFMFMSYSNIRILILVKFGRSRPDLGRIDDGRKRTHNINEKTSV